MNGVTNAKGGFADIKVRAQANCSQTLGELAGILFGRRDFQHTQCFVLLFSFWSSSSSAPAALHDSVLQPPNLLQETYCENTVWLYPGAVWTAQQQQPYTTMNLSSLPWFVVGLGESLILKQYPMNIEKKSGQSAQIYCELHNGNATEDMRLVWYRYTSKSKVGEINLRTRNFTAINRVLFKWDLSTYKASMSITQLVKNDSGEYGCELVSFSSPEIIKKANATNLTVTEEQWIGPQNRNNTDNNKAEEFQNKEARIQIIVAAVLAAFVIICLLIYLLFRYRPKKQGPNANPPPADVSCQVIVLKVIDMH
ncbi:uncharacterized protein LOC132821724 [Hemiscyllium ocellatum]|uniref:uncharacterized protein LOC132821724 n=1 Tax=Hemiscyllium ocellatum TaxID=170820 RepID=UPI002966ACD4|nr:uncharacterized protein LOC132821724 [Hemiscyllium ocellatum]